MRCRSGPNLCHLLDVALVHLDGARPAEVALDHLDGVRDAQGFHEGGVVGGDDDRSSVILQAERQGGYGGAIQMIRGLVQEQHVRGARGEQCECHARLLAAAEQRDQRLVLRCLEAKRPERGPGLLLAEARRRVLHQEVDRRAIHGQCLSQVLREQADLGFAEAASPKLPRALRLLNVARQGLQQRRLAAAVGAKEGHAGSLDKV
mmetsp:Transcript_82849/g.268427  ORF Transcript_82849/g.268427 Transcript_82849/m.268427 type:complete len:205 (+) Transcript_82849:581-1195(+)